MTCLEIHLIASHHPLSPSFDDVHVDDGDSDVVDVPSRPLWARKTLEALGVDVSTLDVQASSGPRRSQRLRNTASIGELLHSNYSLMLRVLVAQDPSHVGEALQ